jgi:general secretion pathway protein M
VRKFTREQAVVLALLCLFVIVCVGLVGWSLSVRFDASQQLSDRQEQLARLEAGARGKGGPNGPGRTRTAPTKAFLQAATSGLAGALLQEHVARLAGQHATLVSFAVQSASEADAVDTVRVEANMEIGLRALQTLLYELESGTPYVLVESMTVRPTAAAQAGAADASLRVTLGLRALWRRNPA